MERRCDPGSLGKALRLHGFFEVSVLRHGPGHQLEVAITDREEQVPAHDPEGHLAGEPLPLIAKYNTAANIAMMIKMTYQNSANTAMIAMTHHASAMPLPVGAGVVVCARADEMARTKPTSIVNRARRICPPWLFSKSLCGMATVRLTSWGRKCRLRTGCGGLR